MRKLFISLLIGIAAIAIVYGQNPTDSARTLYFEALQTSESGDFFRSEVLLKRILEMEYPFSDYHVALIRNNLGYVYYQTGKLEEAYRQYRIAEELAAATDQRTIDLKISIYINQANYYKSLGDYAHSLQFNNEAYRLLYLISEWDALSYSKLSILLLNKGITLYHLERYEEALGILKECEQIKKSRNHPYLGSVYFNLARVYQRLGDNDASFENYGRSIDQWISEYDSSYYELANIYLHFGQFLTAHGQSQEGFEYLNRALENYQSNYGVRHPLTAACFESLSRYKLDAGDWEDALDYLQLALGSMVGDFHSKKSMVNPEIISSSHDLTFLKILATKAVALERASGDFTETHEKTEYLKAALATNHLAIEVLDQIQKPFLSAESRIQLNAQQKGLFATGIRLNLDLSDITGSETYKEEAFLMAAKGKSRELLYEMNQKEWLYLESLSDTVALSATELKRQSNHLANLIQIENLRRNPDATRLLDLQNQLFQTNDSFTKQVEQLYTEFPEISQFEAGSIDFSIHQIRQNLKRKESLVEYFLSGAESADVEQLYIFVVTKKDCQIHQSTVDSVFRKHLQTVTNNLHGFIPYRESKERFDSLKQALFSIYQEIFLPVEPYLIGRDLTIVPDEMLSYIPFDALITHLPSDSIANYAGLPYVLYDYNISYIYNSQLIQTSSSRIGRMPKVTAWIPEYISSSLKNAENLQGALEEVREILEVTRGRSIQKSLKKEELMDVLQEKSIIHLAMHSLALENTGISPYFILDSIRDPLLGNRMHDYEINALNLSSPMVVLSSCETAGGRLHKGEGIMSLSRSFLQAGAASVVHSLWPVEDAKSREIMTGFYRELSRGHSKSRALAQVKKQYIAENPPFYTHPYYWAAFQITGDISPLQIRRQASMVLGSVLVALLIFYGVKRRSFFRRD